MASGITEIEPDDALELHAMNIEDLAHLLVAEDALEKPDGSSKSEMMLFIRTEKGLVRVKALYAELDETQLAEVQDEEA